jgi:hypothetical protein
LFCRTKSTALSALLLTSAACAQSPSASSIQAALERGMAVAVDGTSSVRCTPEREKLAFSCIEQFDSDHFTSVEVLAEPVAPNERRPGHRPSQASDPIFGPGGGGGRYSVTTTDGAYAIHATEFQRLVRGAEPKLPSATRLLEVIATQYDGRPANR